MPSYAQPSGTFARYNQCASNQLGRLCLALLCEAQFMHTPVDGRLRLQEWPC
jgi:hypothetical protein